MKIQTFKDGDRFIVVFEGLEVKEEDMIKGFLSPMFTENVHRPCEVEPIATQEEEIPEIPVVFNDGPYTGKTPNDVLSSSQEDAWNAYVYITEQLSGGKLEEKLSSVCDKEIKTYLRNRFERTNGEEFAAKLSDKQVGMFFKQFGYSIPTDLNTGKREDIPTIINTFK